MVSEPMSDEALAAAQAMVEDAVAAEPAAEVSSPVAPQEAETAVEQQAETAPVEADAEEDPFEIDIPESILADVEADDEPEDDEPEVEEEEDDDLEDDYEDEQVAKLKRELAKERKAREKLAAQKLTADRKRWVEKESKFFPFADVEEVAKKATSRREFRRLAHAENERIKPFVKKQLEKMRSQNKEQAKKDWGSPVAGTGGVPDEASAMSTALKEAQSKGNIVDMAKIRLFGPQQ